MPSRMWRRPSISRKSSCAPRTRPSSWRCNRSISPARCKQFPRRFRILAKVPPKWRWKLPNPRPDCAAGFFAQDFVSRRKYTEFQLLIIFCAMQYFLLHRTKNVLYRMSGSPGFGHAQRSTERDQQRGATASRNSSRTPIMVEATTAPKAKTSKPVTGAFEMPKFEMPKFDIPKVEMPAAFREFAERGVAQAKDTYEKMKAAAEEATDVLETTYSTASKGAADYGLKVIEATRVNTNAAF